MTLHDPVCSVRAGVGYAGYAADWSLCGEYGSFQDCGGIGDVFVARFEGGVGLNAFQVAADAGMVHLAEFVDDPFGDLVGFRFGQRTVEIAAAQSHADDRHGSGQSSAGAVRAAHSQSEAFHQLEHRPFVHADQIRICTCD